jgi:hypothetical protein
MKTFLQYLLEESNGFDPAGFFQQHVQHGHYGGEVKADGPPPKRKGLSDGAKAQLSAAVNIFGETVKRAGHTLTPEQHENLRKHAYGILASHFDSTSPVRIHQYHLVMNGPTTQHPTFTTSVGNADKKEHLDVSLTSSLGHNFSTEVKELSNASLGDFSGRGIPGQIVQHQDQKALTRLYKPVMEPGEGRDIKLSPRAQKTLLRRFEKTTKRKGNNSITVVELNHEAPWNSRNMHFGVSKGQPRLSDTIKMSSKPTGTSWIRHHMRGAKRIVSEPGVLSRRFVQSIGNIMGFKKAIQQIPKLKTKDLFKM